MKRLVLCAVLLVPARAEEAAVAFSVAGRVQDGRGRGLAGARVELSGATGRLAAGTSGADGRFSVAVSRARAARRRDPFGPVRVVATMPDRSPRETTAFASARDLALALPRAHRVHGVVRDRRGGPLAGVAVTALLETAAGIYRATRETGAGGAFEFPAAGRDLRELSVLGPAGLRTLARVPVSGRVEAVVDTSGLDEVSGRVVTAAQRRPVAGARILGPAAEATTDADGRFRLRARGRPVRLGRVRLARVVPVTVVAPGWGLRKLTLSPSRAAAIELWPVAALAGRVLGEGGEPVAACEVELWGRGAGLSFGLVGTAPLRTRTDAAGRFRFAGPPRASRELRVRAAGFRPVRRDVARTPEALTIRLRRGAGVSGRVVDAAGRPAVGARVEVVVAAARKGKPQPSPPFGFADDRGRFRLTGLGVGAMVLRARRGARRGASVRVELDGETFAELPPFVLSDALPLRGVLVDEAGRPIAGAEVSCRGAAGGPSTVSTDERGAFAFRALPVGRYRVGAAPPGHAQVSAAVGAGDLVRLVAERLVGAAVLEVRCEVPDGAGGAVAVWVVHARRPKVWRRGEAPAGVGFVRFEDLVPGPYVVKARVAGGPEVRRRVRVAGGAPTVLKVKLPR